MACVFQDALKQNSTMDCIWRSFLSLSCERALFYNLNDEQNDQKCIAEKDKGSVGIFWDFTTFIFLLIQRRIFQSYYFLHVREDLIVQIGLSSKGNQLFSMWIEQEAKKVGLIFEIIINLELFLIAHCHFLSQKF